MSAVARLASFTVRLCGDVPSLPTVIVPPVPTLMALGLMANWLRCTSALAAAPADVATSSPLALAARITAATAKHTLTRLTAIVRHQRHSEAYAVVTRASG